MTESQIAEVAKLARSARRWGMAGVLLASLGLLVSVWLYVRAEDERDARADQGCAIAEAKQAEDIRGLRITYDYLESLTPRQLREPLNALVVRELPRARGQALTDDSPPFCDEPGVGLPEPDLEVPSPPPGF